MAILIEMGKVRLQVGLLLFVSCSALAQETHRNCIAVDTIYVLYERTKDFNHTMLAEENFISRDTCLILRRGKSISADRNKGFNSYNVSSGRVYFVFVNKKNSRIIAEGIYTSEVFCGRFFLYYRNGKLKLEGFYVDGDVKGGTWKYYKRNGKIKRQETFE